VLAPDDAEVEAYLEVALDAPPPERTTDEPAKPDSVIVLDFGGQTAQLIARRVRELNVYSELLPFDTPWSEIERRQPRAVILSGGPMSVYEEGSPHPDPQIWADAGVPVLGICYGLQLMAFHMGGKVEPADKREQREKDKAAGLVPFAVKLPQELVTSLQALATQREETLNDVTAELLRKGMKAKK